MFSDRVNFSGKAPCDVRVDASRLRFLRLLVETSFRTRFQHESGTVVPACERSTYRSVFGLRRQLQWFQRLMRSRP